MGRINKIIFSLFLVIACCVIFTQCARVNADGLPKDEGSDNMDCNSEPKNPLSKDTQNKRDGSESNQPVSSDPEKMFITAKEYLKSGFFDEAIKKFIAIQIRCAGSEYAKVSTLMEGQALIERAQKTLDRDDLFAAKQKLLEIITKYKEIPSKYSHTFTKFLLNMAKSSRLLCAADYDILPHLLNLLLMYDEGETKSDLYTEIAYQYYLKGDNNEALQYFQKSSSELALIGKALVYEEMGNADKALDIYEDFLEFRCDSKYIEEIKKAYERLLDYSKKGLTYINPSFNVGLICCCKSVKIKSIKCWKRERRALVPCGNPKK